MTGGTTLKPTYAQRGCARTQTRELDALKCVACTGPSKPADHTAWSVQAASIARCQQRLCCAVLCTPAVQVLLLLLLTMPAGCCCPAVPGSPALSSQTGWSSSGKGGSTNKGVHTPQQKGDSSSHAAGLATSRQQLFLSMLLSRLQSPDTVRTQPLALSCHPAAVHSPDPPTAATEHNGLQQWQHTAATAAHRKSPQY